MPSGLRSLPSGTLVDRALERMSDGPVESSTLTRDLMGMDNTPPLVADRIAVALLGADPRVLRLNDGRWALAQARMGSPSLESGSFSVVDVETTGTRPGGGDRIVEIGIVAVQGPNVEVVIDQLVNPERPVSRFTSNLTRITDSMVRDQPTFDDIADDVMGALAGRVFVAHNVRFDWLFVAREMRRARELVLDGPRLCTVQLSRRLIPGLGSRSLDSVARYFGVEIADRHRAAGDALATAEILQRLIGLAQDRGARNLDDLRRLGRPNPRKKKSAMPRSMDEL
jgi:DNA polymerase-3 subunit epsilon